MRGTLLFDQTACSITTFLLCTNADHASGLQTQGVSASGLRGYPANLLLHDRQAQQQASAPQSTQHYHYDLPDSVKYQPQITGLSGPQVDDMHSLPGVAGNSMGGRVRQKGSPQATSQTAIDSRFKHSALPSSRKPSAPIIACILILVSLICAWWNPVVVTQTACSKISCIAVHTTYHAARCTCP